jgi:hypothetical protein
LHWATSGAYVTEVSAIGPLGLEYLDAIDDLRNKLRMPPALTAMRVRR